MRTLFSIIAASFLTACGGGDPPFEGPLPFTSVLQFDGGVNNKAGGVVVRNQTEFSALLTKYIQDSTPAPAVDFNTSQVVGYILGSRPNGCYSVSIIRVTQTSDRIVVTYKETFPSGSVSCTQAITNPSHLVAVPHSPLQVEFRAE